MSGGFDPIDAVTVLEQAQKIEWRCRSCAVQPLLGMYTELGFVHVRNNGRQASPFHVLIVLRGDLEDACPTCLGFGSAKVLTHCRVCHAWREVHFDRQTRSLQERQWLGPRPAVECACEQPDFDPLIKVERIAAAHAERPVPKRAGRAERSWHRKRYRA
jgi:hypothetical protein